MGGRSVKHAVASILVAAGTITAGAPAAVASPAPPATLLSPAPRLAEVIVTAEKRKQSLQSVPAAETVIGAGTLRQQHITTFSGLAQASGSLTITENTSSPNNSINLRGIGTYAFSIGVEPSVSVILDGVPLLQQAQAMANAGSATPAQLQALWASVSSMVLSAHATLVGAQPAAVVPVASAPAPAAEPAPEPAQASSGAPPTPAAATGSVS